MNKIGNYQIPFDEKGNQLHYPGLKDVVWKDNREFYAHLAYSGFQRGRSAANFLFKHPDGRQVTMFLKEFDSVAEKMVAGVLSGTFRFIKRGENYGVLPVKIQDSSILAKSKRFDELDELMGSTRGATDVPIHLSQDDATHDYCVGINYRSYHSGKERSYHGSSLGEAIRKAAAGEKAREGG